MRNFLLALLLACTVPAMSQDYSAAYKTIDSLAQQGKFRSALEAADELFATAERDGDEDDMLKALAYRATYTVNLEENGIEAALALFNRELADNAGRPVIAPVLHYLVGQGYYVYAQQNQYRLRNATAVDQQTRPGPDAPLEDWNLRQLKDAAEEHLLRGLELAGRQRAELAAIPAVVGGDEETRADRSTLFDLLSYASLEALSDPLLSVGNVVPANPERFLVSAEQFVGLDLSALDPEAGSTRQLKVYQDLLRYHLASKTSSGTRVRAQLRADLARIETVRRWTDDPQPVVAALERMREEYAATPGRGLVRVELARLYNRTDDKLGNRPKVKALAYLAAITDNDPQVTRQRELVDAAIRRQSLSVRTENTYPRGENLLLRVDYRNVDHVYHRVVKLSDFEEINQYDMREKNMADWRKRPTVATRNFRLPANDDYSDHATETWLSPLPSGRYLLITSDNENFDPKAGLVAGNVFQVSNLAVVSHQPDDRAFYVVHDRLTGVAKPDHTVTIYRSTDRRNNKWVKVKTVTTDRQGRFKKPVSNGSRLRFVVSHTADADRFVGPSFYSYDNERIDYQNTDVFTPLFTDRAIYRPGQTVHLYGITGEKGTDDMPRLLTNVERSLTLHDANGQEVETVTVRSDEFSRFNHNFTLPATGLTGNFYVNTEGGSISFRVEEYKRPKFKVELTAPDFAVPGEEAEFTGQASLFAGPGVDGAKVSYRVFLEEVRYWWWGRGGGGNERKLVDSGETKTDGAGEFIVRFTPATDLGSDRTRYRYVVETDVADATGETHPAQASVNLRSDKPVVNFAPANDILDVTDSLRLLAAGTDDDLTIAYRIVPVTKPDAALRTRNWAFPDRPVLTQKDYANRFPDFANQAERPLKDWAGTAPAASGNVDVNQGKGQTILDLRGYAVGHYRLEWEYPDGTPGEPAHFRVLDAEKGLLPAGMLYHVKGLVDQKAVVGQPLTFRLISARPLPLVHYAIGSRKDLTEGALSATNVADLSYPVTDADRGGLAFQMNFVWGDELYQPWQNFVLGWEDKELQIDYATFRDKLRPGVPERWTLTVKNADGSPVHAAALASMYDASLDEITTAGAWRFQPFPGYGAYLRNQTLLLDGTNYANGQTTKENPSPSRSFQLPYLDLSPFSWNYRSRESPEYYDAVPTAVERQSRVMSSEDIRNLPTRNIDQIANVAAGVSVSEESEAVTIRGSRSNATDYYVDGVRVNAKTTAAPLPPVEIRKNLQETAFWFPELTSNDAGELTVAFDSPEALTSWKFRVLAHDKELNSAVSERTIVTQKELMVLPNVPRFLREGDALELTARVNNLSDQDFAVRASVEFFDPATNEKLMLGGAAGAGNCSSEAMIGAGSGTTFCFPLDVPEGLSTTGAVGYRVIARGGGFSDGEENLVPILTDRTLITVTKPFYLKRKDKKTVTVAGLGTNDSPTLRHVGYTFQATTQPAWLALKSLPYLQEYPYDCTEQLANRYFANQLAYTTVSSKPILEEVFSQWKNDPAALQSELSKNEKLKNALLTETPWVRAAESEAEQRARIGSLFDLQRLATEQSAALDKLAQRQADDGSFQWFPGGPDNRYVTQYVVESLSRLTQLGAVAEEQSGTLSSISQKAIRYLDAEMADDYQQLITRRDDKKQPGDDWRTSYQPSSTVVHYLYARAMAGTPTPTNKKTREAFEFYTTRAAAKWLDYGLYEQALLAATSAKRRTPLAATIVASLRERAIRKDEFGMYWKYGRGYRWSNLPIETHCRILEAFRLADGTTEELDEMRLWLLSNKRTNRWSTTKATAAAVYALLSTGTDWTTDTEPQPLEIRWPSLASSSELRTRVRAAQETAEAKTGAFSVNVAAGEVTEDLGKVEVKNPGNDLVWGGVFWQYTELARKVAAAADGPLTLERELFLRQPTDEGMRLVPITDQTPLSAGDRVTVRLILRSDRALDFVHLKDRRAATFEPIEQLSGYRYTNGLGYYQAPGDLATNFFLDHLPKGTYTLEYDLFATFSGTFSNGLGRVQCMYAPEFGANSSGARIVVQ